MERVATRRKPKQSDFIGVTSDGVWVPRPPKGPRNFTDRQVREIVVELRKRVNARRQAAQDA